MPAAEESFYILWNKKTDFFHMEPGEPLFFIYSSQDACVSISKDCVLKQFRYPKSDLSTFLYNSGFDVGYFDGKTIRIKKENVAYLAHNVNKLCYIQYKLTEDEMWLDRIDKGKLFALCKMQNDSIQLATITNTQTGEIFALTFTDKTLIPQDVLDNYKDFDVIRYPFDDAVLVNMDVPLTPTQREE